LRRFQRWASGATVRLSSRSDRRPVTPRPGTVLRPTRGPSATLPSPRRRRAPPFRSHDDARSRPVTSGPGCRGAVQGHRGQAICTPARSATTASTSRLRPPAVSVRITASSVAPANRAQPASPDHVPKPSHYRQQRGPGRGCRRPIGRGGVAAGVRQPGIHHDALKAAFAQWGLSPLEQRVGWQPSHFLADRAEASVPLRSLSGWAASTPPLPS
jgi:hypothetical protein